MSKIEVERVPDGIEFHIVETKPYGVLDTYRVVKVSFKPTLPIPELPEEVASLWYCHTELYWLAEHNQWIGFNFTAYQERSMGPNEEDYDGPYLVSNEPPPTEEEIAKAKETGTLPYRYERFWSYDGRLIKAQRR